MIRSLLVILLAASTVRADLVSTRDFVTRPGMLEVPIVLHGGLEIQSLALGLRLSDGQIAGINYDTDTIWQGLPLLTFEGVALPSFETVANVVVNSPNLGAIGNGAVMRLAVDLSDVDPGSIVSMDLNANNLSEAAGPFNEPIPLTFQPGRITVVPEPSAAVLCGSVFCIGMILLVTGRVFA